MISVCIATYNGSQYIEEQLSSILSQLEPTDEVNVSDDGSSDDTVQRINAMADARVKVIQHQKETTKFNIDHSTQNFVNAMSHAKGDTIILSDQDDCWLPGKVIKMTQALRENDLVMSDCHIADEHLNITQVSYADERPFSRSLFKNLLLSSFLGSCMAFHREVFEKARPFPPYGVAHDLWLGMVALRYFRVGYIREPLMLYRRHGGTVTESGKANTNSLFFKIHYRLYVLKALLRLV